jgi:hypothetical protein
MVAGIRKAVTRPGDAHDIGDECRGPRIGAIVLRREHRALAVMLAGPSALQRSGIQAEPPVFADTLPQAFLALRLDHACCLTVRISHGLAEQPPFAQRNRHHGLTGERFERNLCERRHMGVRHRSSSAGGEQQNRQQDQDGPGAAW